MQHILHRYAQLQSVDLEQVQSHVAAVLCPHHLNLHSESKSLNTELYYRAGPRLGFGRLRYGAAVHIRPQPLQDFYLLQIPIEGQEQIQLANQHFNYNTQTAAIINPEQEFEMVHSERANKLFVRICRQSLEQFYQNYYQSTLANSLEFVPLQSLKVTAGQSLWRLLQWQFNEAAEGMLFDNPLATQRLEDTFFASLLDIWPHNQLPHAGTTVSSSLAPHTIKRAKEYIHQHLTQPLNVSMIAQAVGISTRSLYMGFNQFVEQSPMRYVKKQRLNYAHQQLMQADPTIQSVTEIAYLAGFTHLSQFAADYQRLFGVRPSITLHQNG